MSGMDWYVFINILSIIFSCLGLILSVIFLIVICIHLRPLSRNMSLILISNTYLTEITSSIIAIYICCQTIAAILYSSMPDRGILCRIRAYLLYALVSNVMYSFVVQGFFQLFRVVFYQKRIFQTVRAHVIAIIIQWIFVSLIFMIFFPLNDFVYDPSEYRCLIVFENYRGSIMVLGFAFVLPTNLLFTTYFLILRYLRQTHQAMQNQQFSRKRDIAVLKRIMIFLTVLQLFYTPLAIIWVMYIITGHLVPIIYQLQSLTASASQVFMTIFITFGTPRMQTILKNRRQRRVHPIQGVKVQPKEIVEKIRVQRF